MHQSPELKKALGVRAVPTVKLHAGSLGQVASFTCGPKKVRFGLQMATLQTTACTPRESATRACFVFVDSQRWSRLRFIVSTSAGVLWERTRLPSPSARLSRPSSKLSTPRGAPCCSYSSIHVSYVLSSARATLALSHMYEVPSYLHVPLLTQPGIRARAQDRALQRCPQVSRPVRKRRRNDGNGGGRDRQ